jgi:hypothetical protein
VTTLDAERVIAAALRLEGLRLPYGPPSSAELYNNAAPRCLDCSSFVCRAVWEAGIRALDAKGREVTLAASAEWMSRELRERREPRPGDLAVFARRPTDSNERLMASATGGLVYHVMLVLDSTTVLGTCAESDQGELEPGGPFRCHPSHHPGGWQLVGYRTFYR